MIQTPRAIVSLLDSARKATGDLPQDPSWVLPSTVPRYDLGLSNFPVGYGCRDLSASGFTIACFYGDWGSVGVLEQLLRRNEHKSATAEKCESWLATAGFNQLQCVWHTNVLHALRNGTYDPGSRSESGNHPMYGSTRLMYGSASINAIVERETRPRLNVTLGIPAAVAFCHTHRGGDPDGRFASYRRHGELRHSNFTLALLYNYPYRLSDGSIVIHLCHPDYSHLNTRTRWKNQPDGGDVALLRAGLEMARLL